MNPRTTGILLIIAAALGLFVYMELQDEGPRGDAEAAGERLFAFEPDEVSDIYLETSDGQQAHLRREAGDGASGWALVAPVAFPADAFSADGIASSLATLSSEGAFENPGSLTEYGLDDTAARVVRVTAEGETHELRIGRDAPVGSKRYVGVQGDIHAVARFEVNTFEKSLDDLRNKDILDFDRNRVRTIVLGWPGGRVALEGTPDPADNDAIVWRITAPIEAPADQKVVGTLLSEMDFLRAEGFVDDPSAESGLADPAFVAALSGPPGEVGEEAFEVSFAMGAELGDAMRLVRGDQQALYRVAASQLDEFPRELFQYREKALARFSLGDAEQVELFFQQPGGDPVSVVAARDGSEWSSTPEAMDPDRILPMVSELSRLDASGIVAESVGPEELAALELSPPNTIITVRGEVSENSDTAPTLAELRLGRIDGVDGVVVQTVGDPILYRLSIDMGDTLPLNLEAFRNRFLAPEEPEEIPGAAQDDDLLPTPSEESP